MYLKNRVGVLLGGTSAEREVSLTTGNAILEALLSKGVDAVAIDTAEDWRAAIRKEKVQVAFIALHGRGGEDGTIQGALEMMEIPYTGSGVMASAIAMDKIQTKRILMACGLNTPPFAAMGPGQYNEDIPFTLPVVVKPSREGSTIGITVVQDQSELAGAIETAVKHDPYILVEAFVEGDDYTVGVLNNEPLAVIQIVTKTGFYDYHTKYVTGAEDYRVPAPISDEATGRLRASALDAYLAVRCSGAARVDFRGDGEGFSVIEINTIPGMTATSLLPMSANAMGFDFPSLVMEMLKSAGEGSR
ncbi:MAG: D-alanine--D-alanine ligase [bacterium]